MTLKRRKYLGIKYESIQYKENYKFIVTDVKSNSPADKAGIQKNDIIYYINDQLILSPEFLNITLSDKSGEIVFSLIRDGKWERICCFLEERPYEANASYGEIVCRGIKLRTIVTRPCASDVKFPVIIFIPGIYLMSIDFPFSVKHTYKQIVDKLTKSGYMIIRVERPGFGDSEGERNVDLGFGYECSIYQKLLLDLEEEIISGCDLNKVIIMGYSIGGTIAPIIANSSKLKIAGIITYGTVYTNVTQYLLENAKRNPESYDRQIYEELYFKKFLNYYLKKKLKPEDLKKINSQYAEYFTYDESFLGRNYIYFQELDEINVKSVWCNIKNIPVLIIGGALDSLINLEEQKRLYDLLKSNTNASDKIFLKYILADHNFKDKKNQLSQEGIEIILDFLNLL